MTSIVMVIQDLSTPVSFCSVDRHFFDSSLPWGCSARLLINCTMFSFMSGDGSSSNLAILSKLSSPRIQFFPGFIWEREQRQRVAASLTSEMGSVRHLHRGATPPFSTTCFFPRSLNEMAARFVATISLICWFGLCNNPSSLLTHSVSKACSVPTDPWSRFFINFIVLTNISCDFSSSNLSTNLLSKSVSRTASIIVKVSVKLSNASQLFDLIFQTLSFINLANVRMCFFSRMQFLPRSVEQIWTSATLHCYLISLCVLSKCLSRTDTISEVRSA